MKFEYFDANNIKVDSVTAGPSHTMAVTKAFYYHPSTDTQTTVGGMVLGNLSTNTETIVGGMVLGKLSLYSN
jgi:hypothetical protein